MALLQSASDLARQLYSQVQQGGNKVLNTKFLPGQQQTVSQVGQDVKNNFNKYNLYSQLAQGNLNTGFKPFDMAGQTAGKYVQGQFIQPLQTALAPQTNLLNRATSTAQAGFNLLPTASLFNIGVGGVAGALKTARTGGSLAQNIQQSITNPSDIAGTGLGIKNPLVALPVDLLATRNPKATFQNVKSITQSLRGVSPNAFSIHPQDEKVLNVLMDKVFSKGKLTQVDNSNIQDFASHYLGGQYKGSDNRTIALAFQSILANKRGGIAGSVPPPYKMGLAGADQVAQKAPQEATGTQQYLKELINKQQSAGSSGNIGIAQKGRNFLANLKTQLVDSASPIEDAVSMAEKKGRFQVRPTGDVRLQIDRVLRSKSLASQFAEDNGLTNVIKQAPDLNALDQYMIAKQAARVGELGKQTGRDAGKDAQLVKDLAPQYEGLAQQVNQYSRKLLDYSVNSGLIDKNLATELTKKYPDYVPLNRIFNELEQNGYQGAGKSIANLSRQTVVQKLEGSQREIQSPIESLLLKTQTAFQQGERNIAGRQLASYKDLPGFQGLVKELPAGQSASHTFSYLDNGVKKTFATTPEIAAAAKNLNAQQMNVVTKILSYPTRALQLGATGLNVPFAATNLLKDQIDGFINSNRAAKTSILNPTNFIQALFAATKHDDLYKETIRNAGISTSFDIARNEADLAVNKIRAGRNIGSQIGYIARNPGDLLRGLENAIGRTEELTRIQNYKGQYQALIKEGRTPEDARLLAAQAARNNTANFARSGDLGKVINFVIPFFNAGIQGTRSFLRAAKQNPVQTGAKLTASLFLPTAAATLWNVTDPQRKKIYDDIQESDKEKNIIIIPNGATQDPNGKYNVIKIPLPTGLGNLASLVRRGVEQTQGGNPVAAKEVFDSLVGATTPLDTSSPAKFVGGLTPQAIKPLVEGVTNTNLYTGNKIVPDSMKNLPPDQQVKPNTSPIAKTIGGAIGQSPLLVENAARTALGGVGGQVLGQSPTQQLQGRFAQATGGQQQNQQFSDIQKHQMAQAVTSQAKKTALTKVATILLDPNADPTQKTQLIQAISKDKTLYAQLKQEVRDKKLNVTPADRAIRGLSTVERARYINEQLKPLSKDEKRQLVIGYVNKGILTKEVVKELKKQVVQ